jgi:hypothetical protein
MAVALMHEDTNRRTDMMQLPIASRSCYANARDTGQRHSVWHHKVTDRWTSHRTRRDKNRRKMHTQVTTISNVLRIKEHLPTLGLPSVGSPSNQQHPYHFCSITLCSICNNNININVKATCCRPVKWMHLLKGTNKWRPLVNRRLSFRFQKRRRIFLDQFSVSQFLKDSDQASRCSGNVMQLWPEVDGSSSGRTNSRPDLGLYLVFLITRLAKHLHSPSTSTTVSFQIRPHS